jgi:hypothetical protein
VPPVRRLAAARGARRAMRMTRGFGSITFLIIFVTGMISVSLSKFAGWPLWVEELLWDCRRRR